MAAYQELVQLVKDLNTVFGRKTKPALPEKAVDTALRALMEARKAVEPYLPPTPAQKKAAKDHPIASQIKSLTSSNADRKKFFTAEYFKKRFRQLPSEDRKLITQKEPATVKAYLDALILWHYRKGLTDDFASLKDLREQIKADFENSPEQRAKSEANRIYRELALLEDPAEVARRLEQLFAEEKQLKEFADTLSMKIPAQSRAKKAPKKTSHQRLADAIHAKGSLARLEV